MTKSLLTKLSDDAVSIRVFGLVDNLFKNIDALNRIRASGSKGYILTKANVVDTYLFAASIVALVSKIVLTMLGLRTQTLVVMIGDTTSVFASINTNN